MADFEYFVRRRASSRPSAGAKGYILVFGGDAERRVERVRRRITYTPGEHRQRAL